MILFNLERALAGDKVVTRDGREVTQLAHFDKVHTPYKERNLRGVCDGCITAYTDSGYYYRDGKPTKYDLVMAPSQLSGFLNIYHNKINSSWHRSKSSADKLSNDGRIACIDLSTHNEGEGL